MRLVLAALAMAFAWHVHAATVFATPSTLPATLDKSSSLTFKCQAAAPLLASSRSTTLAGWYWRNGKDLAFDGCTFLRSPVNDAGLRFDGIDGLTITNSTFDGIELRVSDLPIRGSTTVPCRRVSVSGSRFLNSRAQGVSATNCDILSVTNSLFRGSNSDGLQCASCRFVEITFNRFDGTVPALGAHPDCGQFFLSPGGVATAHVLIQGNDCEGRTQGFSSFDKGGISDFRILDNNVSLADYDWAVAAHASKGVVIEGNTFRILPGVAFPTKRALGIDARGGSDPISFKDNTMDGCVSLEKCTVY